MSSLGRIPSKSVPQFSLETERVCLDIQAAIQIYFLTIVPCTLIQKNRVSRIIKQSSPDY